jgi:hypothetical protein
MQVSFAEKKYVMLCHQTFLKRKRLPMIRMLELSTLTAFILLVFSFLSVSLSLSLSPPLSLA